MKRYRQKRKEEMAITYSNFIENIIIPYYLSTPIRYPYNCSHVVPVGSPDNYNLSTVDFLRDTAVVNFCDYGHDIHLNTFIKQCNKKNKRMIRSLNMEEFIECTRNHTISPHDLKELNALFNNYLGYMERPGIQEKVRYRKEQNLYSCLISEERNHMSNLQRCFSQYRQPIENTPKNLKLFVPSPVFMAFIIFVFFIGTLFFCKCANKFLHRNENMDRDLPVIRFKNKKVCKSNVNPCSKLEDCIRSCEQNYKRGY